MIKVYTDASDHWKRQLIETEKKRGKLAIKIEDAETEFFDIEQGLIEDLKQYINLFEVKAIRMAMEKVLKERIYEATFYTDSKVARGWADKCSSKADLSEEHLKELRVIKSLKRLFDKIEFKWVPREKNKAGIDLDEIK